MSHHGHDGSAGHQVLLIVLGLGHSLAHLGAHILGGKPELLGDEIDGLGIHALVDADHDTDAHASGDDLRHRNVHHGGQLVGSHKLGEFEHLALCCLCLHLVLHALAYGFTLLAAVFGALAHLVALVGQACQCLAYLLCHLLVAHFGLHGGGGLALVLLLVLVLSAPVLLVGAVVAIAPALAVLVVHLAGHGAHIHTLLAHAHPFLAVAACRGTLPVGSRMVALIALAAFLLAAFLARAGA